MDKKDLIQFCKYYQGEKECPYQASDGRSIWWKIESYAVQAGDKTDKETLSPSMIGYIKERVWQSDSGWSTSWEEALKRAEKLYEIGKWNAGYIADKAADISIAF